MDLRGPSTTLPCCTNQVFVGWIKLEVTEILEKNMRGGNMRED